MNTSIRNRTLLATVLTTLLATSFGASAEPRQPVDQDRHRPAQHEPQKQKQKKKDASDKAAPQQATERRRADRNEQPRGRDAAMERQQAAQRHQSDVVRSQPRQEPRVRQEQPRQEPQVRRQQQVRQPQRNFAQRQAEVRDRVERESHRQSERDQSSRDRIPRQEQQRRIEEQRSRNDDWRRYTDSRARTERERANRLQQQRRMAQYRYQQEYYRRVRTQQARLAALRYDYNSNPYFYLPASYRYSYGGNWHSTNRYGADMLRQAVNRGYQEGVRAGRADRYDRWSGNYRDSFAWIDGSYGYDNYYVSRSDYQYYFRQGFERGYEDGYYSRSRYGRSSNDGSAIILTAILAAILNLQSIG